MSLRKIKAKNTAFTLLELIVVISIVILLGILVIGSYSRYRSNTEDPGFDPDVYINSEYHNTRANMQQAEEFRRANDLRERELRVQEQAIELERQKLQNTQK